MFDALGVAHLVQVIAEIRYAILQILPLVRLHFRGDDLLQVANNPRCRMMLVLEIVTLLIKPLLTFRLIAINRRCRTRQVLSGEERRRGRLATTEALSYMLQRPIRKARPLVGHANSLSAPLQRPI